jgi:glycine cleavage system H lipoate-binding protein
MPCPFLEQTQVRFCGISAAPKMIARATAGAGEKCSSPAHAACALYRERAGQRGPACPHLASTEALYCSAAGVRRFIPRTPQRSRCDGEGYRYCRAYLESAGAPFDAREAVDGIPVPSRLRYSANHMWLDLAPDGCCHIGIDGFFARALGTVERVSPVRLEGKTLPAAILTAQGLDLHVVFPNPAPLSDWNPHLRAHPETLTSDPYGGGWLFAGLTEPAGLVGVAAGLLEAESARDWMRREVGRISGGRTFAGGLLGCLGRAEALALYQAFFSPSETRSLS